MGTPNWENRTLFHGDNLKFLREMNTESVDLIATDPPFNKGRDFHATPESLASGSSFQDRWSWEQDVHQEWIDQITDDYPRLMEAIESARHAHSDGMGAYMCFMAVRLLEMKRILKETGSIYLHCDPMASHYLKAVMDAIFGHAQFMSEISWKRTFSHNDSRTFGNVRDVILFYGNSDINTGSVRVPLNNEYVSKFYRYVDSRGRYLVDNLTGPGTSVGESGNPWRGINPGDVGRCWSVPLTGNYATWIEENIIPGYRSIGTPQERLDALDNVGMIHQSRTGRRVPRLKRYLKASQGQVPSNSWDDINAVQSHSKERIGYPTQKPIKLLDRIIKASSNGGDMVLDPFAGCATTLVASERLRRQWVGIDIWDNAKMVVLQRLAREGLTQKDGERTGLFDEDVHFTAQPPERTDDGEDAAPFLRVKERIKEPEGHKMSRAEMYEFLITQYGFKCQGCDRAFDDPRYLELDHNTPRSDGGLNHISNRVLLCGPCNKLKSNQYTLSGLQRQNKKFGHMYGQQ